MNDDQFITGQKHAFATASLLVGVASFLSLLGMEKAILAMVFAWLALKANPAPRLEERRSWAKIGFVLGLLMFILVPTALILFHDRIAELIAALEKLH
jgi:hypothetical protein